MRQQYLALMLCLTTGLATAQTSGTGGASSPSARNGITVPRLETQGSGTSAGVGSTSPKRTNDSTTGKEPTTSNHDPERAGTSVARDANTGNVGARDATALSAAPVSNTVISNTATVPGSTVPANTSFNVAQPAPPTARPAAVTNAERIDTRPATTGQIQTGGSVVTPGPAPTRAATQRDPAPAAAVGNVVSTPFVPPATGGTVGTGTTIAPTGVTGAVGGPMVAPSGATIGTTVSPLNTTTRVTAPGAPTVVLTPGPTPIPTPATATPTPLSFIPTTDWTPYVGWAPAAGWRPPSGWSPAGGWNPPAGWSAPADWTERLYSWGWSYTPGRGWVVPAGWTPPADFVVPPGWYYMPASAYTQYNLTNPSRVSIIPGRAQTTNAIIQTDVAYRPATEYQITSIAPPPRPVPATAPEVVKIENREQVTKLLSRERTTSRYQGPVLVTESIHFDYDSYAIKPQSFAALDAIGEALVHPPLESSIINIEGHTDSDGSDQYNQQLSEKRAWSVKGYLAQKFGIDPKRLVIVGYGEGAPIAANAEGSGKALNRRVEFENVTGLYNAEVVQTTRTTTTETKSY